MAPWQCAPRVFCRDAARPCFTLVWCLSRGVCECVMPVSSCRHGCSVFCTLVWWWLVPPGLFTGHSRVGLGCSRLAVSSLLNRKFHVLSVSHVLARELDHGTVCGQRAQP